jgi:hypothetical protein
MLERIGEKLVITEFYNVPYGEIFRCFGKWNVKTDVDEYFDNKQHKRIDKEHLVVIPISILSPLKKRQLFLLNEPKGQR